MEEQKSRFHEYFYVNRYPFSLYFSSKPDIYLHQGKVDRGA